MTIPQMTALFSTLVKFQEQLVACACTGFNKFRLQEWMEKKFLKTSYQWENMSDEQRKAHVASVFKGPPPPMEYVVSKGGEFRIYNQAKVLKKPGQRTRPTATLTRPKLSAVRNRHKKAQNAAKSKSKSKQKENPSESGDDVFPPVQSPLRNIEVPDSFDSPREVSISPSGAPNPFESSSDSPVTASIVNNLGNNNTEEDDFDAPTLSTNTRGAVKNLASKNKSVDKRQQEKEQMERLASAQRFLEIQERGEAVIETSIGKENVPPKKKKAPRVTQVAGRQINTPTRFRQPATPTPPSPATVQNPEGDGQILCVPCEVNFSLSISFLIYAL